jgi:hypothetical protein
MTPRNESIIKRDSTSIKIRPDVWKEAKITAIRSDMDVSELIELAIEAWIEEQAQKLAKGSKK